MTANGVSSCTAVRCVIDGLYGDIRFVRLTTATLLFFSIGATILGTVTMFEQLFAGNGTSPGVALLVSISLLVTHQLFTLRRGRSLERFRRRLSAATLLTIVLGATQLAAPRMGPAAWLGQPGSATESTKGLFIFALLVLSVLWVGCHKAMKLCAFRLDGAFSVPMNLLGSPPSGKSVNEKRLVLPPLRRWPWIVWWYLVSSVCNVFGLVVAGALYLISYGLSFLILMPKLLPLLGPKLSRPLFEHGAWAAHMARRYRSPDAPDLLAADPRPPVLLLRSFVDDNRMIAERDSIRWMGQGYSTLEEVLTRRLGHHGPVVAIGKPGEQVPSAGAAREYLTDDAWHSRVEELVTSAMAIVVIAGKTANLGWELARIETLGALPKLSIVIPAESKAEAADRLVTLVKTLDRTRVGELIRDHLHTDAIVVGFGKGTILELASTSRQLSDYAVALDIGMQFFLASRLHES